MTKKDFIHLADTLRYCKPDNIVQPKGYAVRLATWQGIVDEITKDLSRQHPRFQAGIFTDYVAGTNGPNGGKR